MTEPSQTLCRPTRLAELAKWPSPWREAWGHLANAYQDAGIPWPDHEVQAFDQIKTLKDKGGKPPLPKSPTRPAAAVKKATEKTGTLNLGAKK